MGLRLWRIHHDEYARNLHALKSLSVTMSCPLSASVLIMGAESLAEIHLSIASAAQTTSKKINKKFILLNRQCLFGLWACRQCLYGIIQSWR